MKFYPFTILMVAFLVSCNQRKPPHNQQSGLAPNRETAYQTINKDSVEILSLLKNVYRWHGKNPGATIDFDVIVKDSFQTALNYDSFNKTFNTLKQTNYFSSSFINNYKKIADYVNNKLTNANPKYLNEINFAFQDADPWTGFQDDAPDFWDNFKITDYKSTINSASLKWRIQTTDWTSDEYAVAFSKENTQWKVSYLEGFDMSKYYK